MFASLYRSAQYLSLDIVLGAVILLRFFSNILSVSPSIYVYFLLGASVWLIYTIDHIKDSKKAKEALRGRYQFHLKYEKILWTLIAVLLVCCFFCLFYLERSLLVSGGVLLLLSFIYLIVQQFFSRYGAKELYVAMIYSLGILIAPFTMIRSFHLTYFFLLFLLTFLNLMLFSWFEKEEDMRDGFNSIATLFKSVMLEKVILLNLVLGLTFAILMDYSLISFYFLLAFSSYAFLFIRDKWAVKNHRYRTVGDGVFLIPILFEWL